MSNSKIEVKIDKASPFILLSSVLNKPGVGVKICTTLSEHNINIESLNVFSVPGKDKVDILVEVEETDLAEATYFLGRLAKEIQMQGLLYPNVYVEELVTIVLYGGNLAQKKGVAATIFNIFNNRNMNVWAFSANKAGEIRIWVDKKAIEEFPNITKDLSEELNKE
ncbi:MAG: ACT domain-containing protein [bacterium]|nr:ACT domain-containing protein [bacterium]